MRKLWKNNGRALCERKDVNVKRILIGALFGIVMVSALPVLNDYCLYGTELSFHLMRIEGLKDGLLSGQLPVRIQPGWLNGQGYAVSIFEGDFFLLVPALMRVMGFSVQTAYKTVLLLIHIATACISYFCLKGMFRDRVAGIVGSMLYTWMPYRLDAMYGNADLGEATALCFLPVVFYGFYRLLMNETEQKLSMQVWLLPAVGLTGMFFSHVTSFLLAVCMVSLFGLFCWKRVLKKGVLYSLCKIMITVGGLCAWMWVPLLDCLFNGNLLIKYKGALPIQSKGGTLQHYLWTFFRDGRSRDFGDELVVGTAPLGIGFAVTALILLFVWILFTGRYREQRKRQALWKMAGWSVVVGSILMFMSTSVFPWNTLRSRSRVIQLLTAGMDSPMELVPMVTICFLFAGCVTLYEICKMEKKELGIWIVTAVVSTAFATTLFLIGDIINSREPICIQEGKELDTMQILDGAYLPMGADAQTGYFGAGEVGGRDAIRELMKNDLQPEWYWRASELISLGWVLVMCCCQLIKFIKKRRNEATYVEKI